MPGRSTRPSAGRLVLALLVVTAALLALAPPATAAPWGTSGADYDGVLCSIDGTQVPLGAWTVNGTVRAYSTQDIQGRGAAQQPAPVTGSPQTMVPGQAGYSAADIATVAYLLAAQDGASGARAAEVSAAVAGLGGGGLQSRCLGQGGTSAGRARDLLTTARRYAGPYRVDVTTPSGVIPGQNAEVTIRVRSASGAAVPGIRVAVTAGTSSTTIDTNGSGTGRADIAVPASAATAVVATAEVPTGLVYFDTTPPSVTAGPLGQATGTAILRPVLHPRPTVSVDADQLVLAQGTVRPQLRVGGTFGYSGTGEVSLLGPVQPPGRAACSSVPDATLARASASWQDSFTFRGDAGYRASATPALAPGCYALRASVTTSDSSPPERAASQLLPVTVTSLTLATTSAKAVAPGGLVATVVGSNPGGATVRSTVTALGPLPVRRTGCSGDFTDAPVAGSSDARALRAAGGQLRGQLAVPDVRTGGCYALVARSVVSLDGRSAQVASDPMAAATTAVLRPVLTVMPASSSNVLGSPMTGSVQLSGTFGFAGSVAVGLVQGRTLPITGCRDTAFPAEAAGAKSTRVATTGDGGYAFRTAPTARNACYAVVATFTLAQNGAVVASSGDPDADAAFLAGVRPDTGAGSVVQQPGEGGILRALVTYLLVALLILAGCVALFLRTFRRERGAADRSLWRWRPNHSDDEPRPPRPGDGSRPRPMPQTEPPGVL